MVTCPVCQADVAPLAVHDRQVLSGHASRRDGRTCSGSGMFTDHRYVPASPA